MITRHFIKNKTTDIPDSIIYYTSTDGDIVTPSATSVFGANIVSNTYKNGKGIIIFDAPVTSIGGLAFDSCSSLSSIIIPNSVTSIGSSAFSSCSSLTSVVIPDGVTSIRSAFTNCVSLTNITIPKDLSNLASYAFKGCDALHTIIWNATHCNNLGGPNNMQGYLINTDTAKHITTFIIGNSVEVLPYWICRGMSIKNIVIPNNVLIIEDRVFDYCDALTSIVIGNGVTNIGEEAFMNCTSLTTITCKATTPPALGSSNNLSNVTSVYVPAESVEAYKVATNWSYYADKIQPIP